MQQDIRKLDPMIAPQYVAYTLGHFWELWGMFGQNMTLHDVVLYQRTFATAMSRMDMLLIMRAYRKALAFIDDMQEDSKSKQKPAK